MMLKSDIPCKISKAIFKRFGNPCECLEGDLFFGAFDLPDVMRAVRKSCLLIPKDFLKEISKFDVIVVRSNAIVWGIHP